MTAVKILIAAKRLYSPYELAINPKAIGSHIPCNPEKLCRIDSRVDFRLVE